MQKPDGRRTRALELFTAFLFLLGAAAVVGGPAIAETPARQGSAGGQLAQAKPPTAPAAWSLTCSNFGKKQISRCRVFQNIYLRKTKQLLLSIAVQRTQPSGGPVMVIQTPFGTFLPAGVTVVVDKHKPQMVPYQTCNKTGCFATLKLSILHLSRLRGGKVLVVSIQNLNRKAIRVRMGLKGFAPAYAKMSAN
jgi:invasion protein IalB